MDALITLLAVSALAGIIAYAVGKQAKSTGHDELMCVSGPRQGQRFPLRAAQVRIGRGPDNTIKLDEMLVSRNHALITNIAGQYYLQDAGSANGIWMRGQRVMKSEMPPGEAFQIGANIFVLKTRGSPPGFPAQAAPQQTLPSAPIHVKISSNINDYEVGEHISTGGQATVHLARSRIDGSTVVVKFLTNLPANADGLYFRDKFLQQIHLGMDIRHPHCVQVLGGDANANPPYIIEEYLSGGTLRDRMRGSLIPMQEIIRITGELCDGLYYLHQKGIVHRDLSPENIMFDADGRARLIDFGLARLSGGQVKTQFGMIVGKSRYMSVEQARGDPNLICPQSDLYSLGVMAYEMATGRPPFDGDDLEILTQHIKHKPRALREISPQVPLLVERAVMTALEKDPRQRFPDARLMAKAFGYPGPFHAGGADAISKTHQASNLPQTPGPAPFAFRPAQVYVTTTGQTLGIQQPVFELRRSQINPADDQMSRAHGQIVLREGSWWVAEGRQPSANGIFVNGARIFSSHGLRNGDEIRLGRTVLRFMDS